MGWGGKGKGKGKVLGDIWSCTKCGCPNFPQHKWCSTCGEKRQVSTNDQLQKELASIKAELKKVAKGAAPDTDSGKTKSTKNKEGWYCADPTCREHHHNMACQKFRTCGKPRAAPRTPAPKDVPPQPLPGAPRPQTDHSPTYSSVVSSPSPSSSTPASSPASSDFQHPTLKVGPLSDVKHIATSLTQMGITVAGSDNTTPVVDPTPKCAQASSDVAFTRTLYERAVAEKGEDSSLAKALKSELDKILTKASPVAQMVNQKQILETKLALTKRRTALEADHDRIRKIEQEHLDALHAKVKDQQFYMETMEVNFRKDLDEHDAYLAKVIDQEQQVEALKPSNHMEVSEPVSVVLDPVISATPAFETLRKTVQAAIDGLTSPTPTAPDDTLFKLTQVLSAISATSTTPSTFGPAAATGTLAAARAETHPYHAEPAHTAEGTGTASDLP